MKAKYPGAFPSPEKISEARKSLGLPLTGNLNNDEVNKLKDELSKDEHFKLVSEIVSEDPKKYLGEINGPELVIAEMDKRLKKPESKNNKIELTQEELDAKVQAEIERRRLADGESITSTNGGKKVTGKDKKEGSLSTEQQRVALKSKIGAEAYEKMLQRRDNIPGAGSGKDKDD